MIPCYDKALGLEVHMRLYGSELLEPPQLSYSGDRHLSEGAQGLAQLSTQSMLSD